jgi:hypothetical protein
VTAHVRAAWAWKDNGYLIAEAARLGYLDGHVLDCTYGAGVFWKQWRPEKLTTHDLRIDGVDFRNLPHPDGTFDASVIDGPYKLNGASSEPDIRYGVDLYASWQGRHQLIQEGMTECARVTVPRGYVLVKCQAQVCSGAIRWQDREFADHGESLGMTLVDRFDLLGKGRKQPERTRQDGKPSLQHHAYGRPSTLLVFRKSVGVTALPQLVSSPGAPQSLAGGARNARLGSSPEGSPIGRPGSRD